MSLVLGVSVSAQQPQQADKQCHWWQFRCEEKQIEGLPADAPRQGTVITIDVATNRLYLFKEGKLVDKSLAATGSEKLLKNGSRVWFFRTPQGHHKVLRKIIDPVWTKPDWAFIEAGEPVPPPNSPLRKVKGHLGKYALDLGDGIMIHGTDEYDSIGRKASHGCIRLPNDMLETVYNETPIGADVYIFESKVPQTAKKGERHSDLDF
jgi:lipoprotein-anchoring transpeptidase ErfK/SrfK